MVILEVIKEVGELALVSFGHNYSGPVISFGVVRFNLATKEWNWLPNQKAAKTLVEAEKSFRAFG